MKLNTPISIAELAKILDSAYMGDPEHIVTGINEIHMVESGDLTFVDVEKYYKKALSSAATTILINKETEIPEGKALLISDDPFRDFNKLTEYFQPSQSLAKASQPNLSSGVEIGQGVAFGENVNIGENTQIGHNVVIGSHVSIGKNCRIHANVSIYDNAIIGDEVTINSGTIIGGEAFYFKARPYGRDKMLTKGKVRIGNHVDIGANCTIDRGVTGETVIGDWTKLDNLIQIGHDTIIGKRCILASQVGIAGVCIIEDDVVLWGQVGISKDVTIGQGAVLLGKTGVMSSLEGRQTYLGMIAAPHRQVMRELLATRKLPDIISDMSKAKK